MAQFNYEDSFAENIKNFSFDNSLINTKFTLMFIDLVHTDKSNENEVLSDQLLIAQDCIAYFSNISWANLNLFIDKNINIINNTGCKLIHFICSYSSPEMIKYIIDKNLPDIKRYRNIVKIEKTATEGSHDLIKMP